MKTLVPAFLLLWSSALAADPLPVISSPQLEVPKPGVINVSVGNPPQVDLFVSDPPEGSRQQWTGPLDKDEPGRRTVDGVSHSTSIAGSYEYRCVIQTPLPDFDDIMILDIKIVVTGTGPLPPPQPIPPTPVPPTPTPPIPPVPPTPGPVIPEGRFGLARPVYNAALLVQSPTRAADAQELAKAFEATRTIAAALQQVGPEQMMDMLGAALAAFENKAAWESWNIAFEKAMDAAAERATDPLSDKAGYLDAFAEVEAGLRAVR